MSSRALRRRLEREGTAGPNANGKDPQAVASTTSSDGEDNDNVDEYDELPVSSTVNAFDLLGGDADDADDVDDEDPGERDSAQAQDMDDDDDETAAPATLPPPRAAKPKRRKKKKKAKQSVDDVTAEADAAPSNDDDDDLDEVDRALRELNVQLGGDSSSELIPRTNITTAFCLSPLDELLAVDAQRLDPDAELRRLFGRSVLAEERQANAALPQAHRRRGPAAATSRYPGRYHLCSPQDTWPPGMARLGLEMELVGETGHGTSHDARTSPRQWFAFTHSTRYRDLEEQFMDRVATMIPESLMNMLQLYPAHTSTLLQLSYIAEQQGDHGASLAFLSRAMFTFERAFHALFTPASSASASLRVSYFRQENRGFMIATWRSIAAWMRKGCWRAAFEWSKMLASLSREDYGDAEGQHRLDGSPVPAVAVHSDPLGVWLVLDFLAVRCGEHGWVKRIWSQRHGNSSDAVRVPLLLGAKPVEWYPGWWYSTALALFLDREQSNMGDSRNALVEAMLRFPWIARVLVGRCGMQLNATELGSDDGLGHEHFNDVRFEQDDDASTPAGALRLLMEVYVERAHSLWKEPEVIQWFRECIPTAVARLRDQGDARAQQLSADARALGAYHMVDFPTGVLRHVFLSDLKSASSSGNNGPALSLERFIPARYKTGSQSLTPWGAPQLTFLDPLPPTFIPRDVPTAAIGTALRSPIDPYDRYHRRQLVRRHPHEAVPIVAERIGEDADEERRLGVSRYELREAAGVSGLTMGGGVLATLLQSLLPWTSVGAGASSGGNGDGPLDVPGMQAFLRGDLREQKS